MVGEELARHLYGGVRQSFPMENPDRNLIAEEGTLNNA